MVHTFHLRNGERGFRLCVNWYSIMFSLFSMFRAGPNDVHNFSMFRAGPNDVHIKWPDHKKNRAEFIMAVVLPQIAVTK